MSAVDHPKNETQSRSSSDSRTTAIETSHHEHAKPLVLSVVRRDLKAKTSICKTHKLPLPFSVTRLPRFDSAYDHFFDEIFWLYIAVVVQRLSAPSSNQPLPEKFIVPAVQHVRLYKEPTAPRYPQLLKLQRCIKNGAYC